MEIDPEVTRDWKVVFTLFLVTFTLFALQDFFELEYSSFLESYAGQILDLLIF